MMESGDVRATPAANRAEMISGVRSASQAPRQRVVVTVHTLRITEAEEIRKTHPSDLTRDWRCEGLETSNRLF